MSLFIYPPTPVSVTVPPTGILVNGVPTEINQNTSDPSLSQTMPSLSHFIKNGAQVVVNYDGITKSNINAVPVMLVGADGTEATINVTTGDLNIQATHTGVNPDSMQIGDGTTILAMTLTGEATVHDAEVLAELKALILQLPATLGSKIDDESLSVTQSVEDKAIQEDIKTAVESLVTVGSTEAKQDAIIADIGLLAKLTDTQPISAATLPLPTGAAEESTLQAVDSKLINIRDALPISRGSKPDAASLAVTQSTEDKLMQADIKDVLDNILLDTAALIAATQATSLDALGFYTHNFATTSVTSSAYVELVSNIGGTEVKKIKIFMSNGNPLIIAQGAASAETDRFLITAGGFPDGAIEVKIPAGERLSMKALSTDLTSGLIAINLMG